VDPKPAGPSPGPLSVLFSAARTPLERLQNGFDAYSWLTFLALNQPADRGVKFGTSDARILWESAPSPGHPILVPSPVIPFFPVDEVMHLAPNFPEECRSLANSGPAPVLFVTKDEVAFDQPFKTGPLIDQQGHYS